jgi:Tfp pilus assembly ATPase PilU
MVLNEDYGALIRRMEELLAELDRLQLPYIAVHVDLAMRNLEELIAGSTASEKSDQN